MAIVEDDITMAEFTADFKKTHSQTLLAHDRRHGKASGDRAVHSGRHCGFRRPWLLYGLKDRFGHGQGLGLALDKPLIHVPTLDATAYNLYGADALVCPIMDARRNQVYTGIYRFREEFEILREQDAMDMGELLEVLNGLGEPVIFLGDGVPVFKDQIRERLTVPFSFAPAHVNRQRAAAVAALGARYFAEGKMESSDDYRPDYLRKSQAEREREEREAKEGGR